MCTRQLQKVVVVDVVTLHHRGQASSPLHLRQRSLPQVPRGASKSKPLRYEVSQRELEEMMREQG